MVNILWPDPIACRIEGAKPSSRPAEHLPSSADVAVCIRRDKVLTIGEDGLAVSPKWRFLRRNTLRVAQLRCSRGRIFAGQSSTTSRTASAVRAHDAPSDPTGHGPDLGTEVAPSRSTFNPSTNGPNARRDKRTSSRTG